MVSRAGKGNGSEGPPSDFEPEEVSACGLKCVLSVECCTHQVSYEREGIHTGIVADSNAGQILKVKAHL